jgi:transcriptional regulator with XRE-family HTH domain
MPRATESTNDERHTFATALTDAFDDYKSHGGSQAKLARQLSDIVGSKISQSAISRWMLGDHEPPRRHIFALEELLNLPAGTLTRPLGYLPTSAVEIVTVPQAIAADQGLTPTQREDLGAAYEQMLDRTRARRLAQRPQPERGLR